MGSLSRTCAMLQELAVGPGFRFSPNQEQASLQFCATSHWLVHTRHPALLIVESRSLSEFLLSVIMELAHNNSEPDVNSLALNLCTCCSQAHVWNRNIYTAGDEPIFFCYTGPI